MPTSLLTQTRLPPGTPARLARRDPADTLGFADKATAKHFLEKRLGQLATLQQTFYADARYSVLIILQAMDAAGKDGLIKHVMSGLNPQGCQVTSFKQPSAEALAHDYLWRIHQHTPALGQIGIFNRSHYEDVLITRVHPQLLKHQTAPTPAFWRTRYRQINDFERHLTENGTLVLKCYLHLSPQEQKKRLLARIDDPAKNWKFSAGDIAERAQWPRYQRAYEEALTATSTPHAPWHILPADHKWVTRAAAADLLVKTLRGLKLRPPPPPPDHQRTLEQARRQLEQEP